MVFVVIQWNETVSIVIKWTKTVYCICTLHSYKKDCDKYNLKDPSRLGCCKLKKLIVIPSLGKAE